MRFLSWLCALKNLETGESSFFQVSYTRNNGFVGIDNYWEILTTAQYNRAIWVSLYYMCAAVIQVLLALVLSFLLMKCRFSNIYKAIYAIPYLINGIAIGYMFRLFYSHGYVLDSLLELIGFDLEKLPFWLRDQRINNWALAFASVWRYTGLSLIIFVGVIASVQRDVLEASSLDGAGRWSQFRYIIWPQIRPTVCLNLLLSVTSSLSEFEIPYTIASGGSNGTATYMTLIYRVAFVERKLGLASAMVVLLLMQLVFCALLLLEISKRLWQQPEGVSER